MPNTHESNRKVIFVLVDGLGDLCSLNSGSATSLQSATVPILDYLAKRGLTGIMDPVRPGIACGSDTAHLSILGYDPKRVYRGRGAFESLGAGLEVEDGDIAFKSNFAVLSESQTRIVMHRRCDRKFEEWGKGLCEYLTENIQLKEYPDISVVIQYATEHRCGVRIRSSNPEKPLSGDITGTDPLKDGLPLITCRPLISGDADAIYSSEVVNSLSREIQNLLDNHPDIKKRRDAGLTYSNGILLRGAGIRVPVQPFEQKWGMKAFMIAPTAVIAGIGISLGIHRICPTGATGDYRTDLNAKADSLIETFESNDGYQFGFLHIKAVDDAGHDMNPVLKISFLEKIDKMMDRILSNLRRKGSLNEVNLIFFLPFVLPNVYFLL